MYQTRISQVSGKECIDESGKTLERIGNMNINSGDVVWTDGVVIYGNGYDDSYTPPTFAGGDGIPVGFGKYFYILSNQDGSVKRSYEISDNVEIIGFVNDEKNAFVELTADGGTTVEWYDVLKGTLVYATDERAADAQVETEGSGKEKTSHLLTLELGDVAGYNTKSNIGLYKSGSLTVSLPTAAEVSRAGLNKLLAEAGSKSGSVSISGHSGRITKGGNFYTTLANFSGQAEYVGTDYTLSKQAKVGVGGMMNASGRAYTENGSLTWAQFSTDIQNLLVIRASYEIINEDDKDDEPVEDNVISVIQGVGAVTQWTDPYLRDDNGVARTAPILILIMNGGGFTTVFPFPQEMYGSDDEYWDAWGKCILKPDGSQFIRQKGNELLGGYVKPRGAYFYYSNSLASDSTTYRNHFPMNDDFRIDKSGNVWTITDNGEFVYSSGYDYSHGSLYRVRDTGYLLQNGDRADKIDGNSHNKTAVCGSRNYRFCNMSNVEKMFLMLAKILDEKYGATIK